jgi:fatty-acyl-CoA synthase
MRALELTAPIARNRDRILPTVIDELAGQHEDAPALLSERECLTYRQLSERANRYARWALDQGVAQGRVVGLLMTNRPEYLAIWLGITKVGRRRRSLTEYQSGWKIARTLHRCCIASPFHRSRRIR